MFIDVFKNAFFRNIFPNEKRTIRFTKLIWIHRFVATNQGRTRSFILVKSDIYANVY